ncbi:MAG TPA: nucleotidyltransferase family protein, partial [Gaiellaceae bacterium]|nr:nucleotidyltransferase family protein [Gaiellaceae bacterium]
MTRRRSQTGPPPELAQQLLRVCYLPAHDAGAMWDAALAGSLDLDALHVDLHGLLPLLHRRLVELDRTSPDMDRLKGVRRRLWVQNELRLRAVRTAREELHAAGAPSVLIGGVGVLVGHLGRADLRPLHDADLLVTPPDAAVATGALRRAGWQIGPAWHGGFLLDLHGVRCQDPTGQAVSLRWSSWPPYPDAAHHATQVELSDARFDVASAADLLVHTLLDGPAVHRASDALAILLGEHDLDWDRVERTAAARNARAALRDSLAALDAIVPLPRSVT